MEEKTLVNDIAALFPEIKYKCTQSETNSLGDLANFTEKQVPRLIEQIQKRMQVGSKNLDALKNAVKVLECINSMSKVKVFCFDEQGGSLCPGNAAASQGNLLLGVGPYVNTKRINICPAFWDASSKTQRGVFIHELSHMCGTNDDAYFRSWTPLKTPQSTEKSSWSNIADTYQYWLSFGFCEPEVDC